VFLLVIAALMMFLGVAFIVDVIDAKRFRKQMENAPPPKIIHLKSKTEEKSEDDG